MKKKKYFYFGLIIVPILFIYYGHIYTVKQEKDNFDKFNKYNIHNVILNLNPQSRSTILQFKEDTLSFYPKTSELNDNNIFNFIAKKGDSVIKKPFQDTLILKKTDGSIYKYTFMKPTK